MLKIPTLLATLALSTPAFAITGTVAHLDGELFLEGAPAKSLKVGETVSAGSTVHLKKGPVAILVLDDGVQLKFKTGTRFQIGKGGTPTVELMQGALFARVQGPKTQVPRFFIKSQSVMMGVRGTQFFTATTEKNHLWMCVHEGEVEVTKTQGKEKNSVRVKAGEGIVVEPEKAIAPPKAYEWTKQLNWNMNPKDGDVEDHSKMDAAYGELLKQKYD